MKELEQTILEHLVERGWDNLRPGDVSKSILIEGAELLEHFQWTNPTLEEVRKDDVLKEKISEELADILIYALELSALLDLNAEKIILKKLEKVKKKYPAALMKEAATAGDPSLYWKIKKEHRKKGS
jgi:NTP pyrophosphatase (non-canonical NTP hydrolase)